MLHSWLVTNGLKDVSICSCTQTASLVSFSFHSVEISSLTLPQPKYILPLETILQRAHCLTLQVNCKTNETQTTQQETNWKREIRSKRKERQFVSKSKTDLLYLFAVMSLRVWHHIAVTYSSSAKLTQLYVNGTFAGQMSFNFTNEPLIYPGTILLPSDESILLHC